MLESQFQNELISDLRFLFPGCIILKNDANYLQGVPDLTILFKNLWATLEVKPSSGARHRPNQDHYVSEMNKMSFSAFIYPENKKEVLDALQRAFGTVGSTRVSSR